MDKLNIDEGMRNLVRQLWKHNYRTVASCEGHGDRAEILLIDKSGDGWFESNAHKYGLSKQENSKCCNEEFEKEVLKYGLNPREVIDRRKACGECGAGVNGYVMYRGMLISNPPIYKD